jgi:hypothetical protein
MLGFRVIRSQYQWEVLRYRGGGGRGDGGQRGHEAAGAAPRSRVELEGADEAEGMNTMKNGEIYGQRKEKGKKMTIWRGGSRRGGGKGSGQSRMNTTKKNGEICG